MTDTGGLIRELSRLSWRARGHETELANVLDRAADALAAQAQDYREAIHRIQVLNGDLAEQEEEIMARAGEIERLNDTVNALSAKYDGISIISGRARRAALEEAITAVRRAQPYDQNGDVVLFNTAIAAIRALIDKEPPHE